MSQLGNLASNEDNKERIPIPTNRNSLQGQMTMAKKMLPPIPPGEVLLEEFMKPNKISQNGLARDIDINPARVNDIVHGRSAIIAPMALRLAN